MSSHGTGNKRLLAMLGWLLAAYLISTLTAVILFSPRIPYADVWRFVTFLDAGTFPGNVFRVDNGHREVLPHLLRGYELRNHAANQWLQITTGILLAVLTLVMLAQAGLPKRFRDGLPVMMVLVLGVFWLGNQRTLTHGNESVHAYLITSCLAAGILLLQRRAGLWSLLPTAALGFVATFSFGTGIACFPAFVVLAVLLGYPARQWLLLVAAAVLAACLYRLGGSQGGELEWLPLTQAQLLCRWLASPWVYAGWPAFDPQIAQQIPTSAGRTLAQSVAGHWQQAFGPPFTATCPWLGIGLLGVLWYTGLLFKAYKDKNEVQAAVVVGMSLASFGLAVGGVIVIARTDYFLSFSPSQLMSARYHVWSSLFWTGLLVASMARFQLRKAACVAALLAIFMLPSQIWMGRLSQHTRYIADDNAAGMAMGVLTREQPLGENVADEMVAAMPVLKKHRAAMFAWPEMQRMGLILQPNDMQAVVSSDWLLTVVDNRLGTPAQRVHFQANAKGSRLLLVDGNNTAMGLATPAGRGRWQGWIRGHTAVADLRAVRLKPADS